MFNGQLARRIHRKTSISIALVLFLFTTAVSFTLDGSRSATAIHGPETNSAFDALLIAEDSSLAPGCAATAAVRWLPGTKVNINYVREDFTESELSAFHDAVTRWQQTLLPINLGIVLSESDAGDKTATPKRLEIIVKRDHQMAANLYGRIVASARPDNYLDSATVLINGSLHKPKPLRKVLMHELGHAFGLRDCSNCRGGATVMNYFSQLSAFGVKVRDGNVADKPTVSDISQVQFGYRNTPAPRVDFETTEASAGQTIVADEIVATSESVVAHDENILAPYLTSKPKGGNSLAGVPTPDGRALTIVERAEFESHLPKLFEAEAATMEELKNYSFRREVRIQTIDNKGRVTGEYRRISDMLLDDAGRRIERNLSLSKPTLRGLEISNEYVEDFSGAQLKGFELAQREHYRFEPFGTDTIDRKATRVYRITPQNLNAERASQARVFYGFAWVDEETGTILKIAGCALPDDKKRYPLFETQRAVIDGRHLFPVRTIADDYLVFPSRRVHIRMLITYTDYKRFASRVNIVELDPAEPEPSVVPDRPSFPIRHNPIWCDSAVGGTSIGFYFTSFCSHDLEEY